MFFVDKNGKAIQTNTSGPQAIYGLKDKSYTLIADHAFEGKASNPAALVSEGRAFYVDDFEFDDNVKKNIAQRLESIRQSVMTFNYGTYEATAYLSYMPDILAYKLSDKTMRVIVETPMLRTGEGEDKSVVGDNASQIKFMFKDKNLSCQIRSLKEGQIRDTIHEQFIFKPFTDDDVLYYKTSTDLVKHQTALQIAAQQEKQQEQELQTTVAVPAIEENSEIIRGNDYTIQQLLNAIYAKQQEKKERLFGRLWNGNGYYKNQRDNDKKLLQILIWWTNHDLEKTDKMFRQSGQMKNSNWNDPTYREIMLHEADQSVEGGNFGVYELKPLTPETYPKSMANFFKMLDQERLKWHAAHDEKDKNGKIIKHKSMSNDDVIKILQAKEKWARPYRDENERRNPNLPKMYYDWDLGIYRRSEEVIMQIIAHVDHDVSGDKNRQKIFEDMVARGAIPKRQITKYTHPELIPCGNGIFNRKTKELLKYDPDKYCFTQQVATNYNASATVEPVFGENKWSLYKWLKYGVAKGDKDMFYTIKQVLLAAATGDIRASKFAMFYDDGSGSTGKSTLTEFIEYLVGSLNSSTIDFTSSNISNSLFAAYGSQVLIFDDPSTGGNARIGNMGVLKKLVSNQKVELWQKFRDKFSAPMNAFLIMAINGQPKFEEMDSAIAKRMLPIEFTQTFDRNNPADQRVEDVYIKDQGLREFVLNDLLNNVTLDDGFKLQKSPDDIAAESFGDYDPFTAFNEDELSHWKTPYIPGQLAFNTYYNYAKAGHFQNNDVLNVRQFFKKAVQNGWGKKHGRVPRAFAIPLHYLSTHNDTTPLKTDIDAADYIQAYKDVSDAILQYEQSAGRLANGSKIFYGAEKEGGYDTPKYLAGLPVTTLLIKPELIDVYKQYIEKRKQDVARYTELLDYKMIGGANPDLSGVTLDDLHFRIMQLEKYLKDHPDNTGRLTSRYDELISKQSK